MDFLELIKTRRTVRFFKQQPIDEKTLIDFVDAARCAPSGGNGQPLEFIIINQAETVAQIFEQLAWAYNVKPKHNPPVGKRPVAYILVINNDEISKSKPCQSADAAAAIENILLAAWSKGIGSCWLGSINHKNIREILDISSQYSIDSIVALGYPGEEPIMEDAAGDSVKYYLDDEDRLHIPKRPLPTITHINKFVQRIE